MKKNIFYMIACGVMVLAAAACSKEQANNEPQEEPAELVTESLSAQKESEATKVRLDGATLKFGWSDKDKAAFSIYDGVAYDFVESDFYGATATGTFTVSYTGTRQGYAVIPSTFAKSLSADGNTLTVTYPSSYDISADVDAGTYDNADGAHFIPFPMVAKSQPGEPSLIFNSIGALVKVDVSHVPAGTKNLYVTFNQTVTGDFVVSELTTPTRFVSVSDTSTPSTVTVKISESGLAAEQTITLYIPVPTTTNLCIASVADANKKATVERNKGYKFSCEAISRVNNSSDLMIGSKNYTLAPGNLLGYNDGENDIFSFLSGMNQLKTTKGNGPDGVADPHVLETVAAPSRAGQYQDLFTWNDMFKLLTGVAASEPASNQTIEESNTMTVAGHDDWFLPSWTLLQQITTSASRTNAGTIWVHGVQGVAQSRTIVDVRGSSYAEWGVPYSGSWTGKQVFGRLIFPDGYIDQTDLLNTYTFSDVTNHLNSIITSAQFERMIAAGAWFMINAGFYRDGQARGVGGDNWSYLLPTTSTSDVTKASRTNGGVGTQIGNIYSLDKESGYTSIRLIRDMTDD